ncbi:hypothetical protein DUI87_30070 [Hirundo rustica rustica]|uniref:non-specific serine/threonine protein kinase n=1 Tax=Hirundo rustica rustica TaxID=333673 RepID=A0A3M0IXN0_HIRRU|nr:hypothetical protein DUI87_30070 [Hirundo rustica rustica]
MLTAQLETDGGAQKKFAIKQVECIDQHQANVALKEAMDLLKLRHSNICTYKEFFVTWSNEVPSLFLCLVMQHSGQGDLSALIEEKRQKSEKIRDTVVEKFLGQMVDALFYIHKQNIWHRNVKPSNILVTSETSFMLSDFSTETLMKDELKWKIRVEEEFMQASWDIEEVQTKGIQQLASFVKDKSAFPYLLTCTEVIALAMRTHTDSLELQVEGCTLLLEILSQGNSENNADQAVLESALPVTSAVLQEHLQNGAVAESACSALWALALQGCLSDSDYEPTAALLLDAVRMNPERAVLVKNGCLALASLVRLSETAALAILLDSKGSGVELIEDEYHLHLDEPAVAEALCLLMNEMVQYDEVMLAMRSHKMEKLLSEIKLQFPFSTEIQTLVGATLLKLRKEKRFV